MPQMLLGQIVVRQIQRGKAFFGERSGDFCAFAFAMGREAHENMRFFTARDAVVELRHIARTARQAANRLAKTPETPALLRHRDRQQRLALLAHFSALRHEAQAVKIHVCAAQNRGIGLALGFVRSDILLDRRHRQSPRGLHDAARIGEHILDRRADRIGVHLNELIHQMPGHAKRFLAHQLHRRAIGEQPHIRQSHALFRPHRLQHGIRVVHLHANDLPLGPHRLDVIGHTRDQPPAANRHKHRIERPLMLAQHLHGNRALPSDHLRVVKRVDKGQALLLFNQQSMLVRIRVALAMQHHFAAQIFHRINLDLRRRRRHHDHGARAQLACAQRHALRMVACRRTNHAFLQLLTAQMRHLVVGAAQLEAEHRLLVFALQEHFVVQAARQGLGGRQIRLHRHIVDARIENFGEIVRRSERFFCCFDHARIVGGVLHSTKKAPIHC